MIGKVIKITLVALLVFFACAPVIVGVYDATGNNVSRTDGTAKTDGVIKIYSDGGINNKQPSVNGEVSPTSAGVLEKSKDELSGSRELGEAVYSELPGIYTADSEKAFEENEFGRVQVLDTKTDEEYSFTTHDWYSGSSDIDKLFNTGAAHLVYTFPDGSIVDFGNPYEPYWDEDSLPPDYYEVIAQYDESQSSIFSPEKAYAGPLTWALKKLNYLAIKSGYWKSVNNAIWGVMMAGATAAGMYIPQVQQFLVRYQPQIAAVQQYTATKGVVIPEEDIAMLVSDSMMVLSRSGGSVTQLPQVVLQNAQSVATTGQLLSGGSGNFLTAMYQVLTTNQISANFVMANSDFFNMFFEWLGAEISQFEDAPTLGASEAVNMQINIGGEVVASLPPISFKDNFSEYKWPGGTNGSVLLGEMEDWGIITDKKVYSKTVIAQAEYYLPSLGDALQMRTGNATTGTVNVGICAQIRDGLSYKWSWISVRKDIPQGEVLAWLRTNGAVYDKNTNITLKIGNKIGDEQVYLLYDGKNGTGWNSEIVVNVGTGSDLSPIQVIGADAEFDENGNLINPGNLNVSDVTSPDYVQPGTFQDALDQMHATATDTIPARPESPAFGNNQGTVDDWLNQNKPTPPDPAAKPSQDDFKIADLEKVFPYCIPWDIYYFLAAFAAEPQAPNFTWTFDFAGLGKHDFTVDLSPFEAAAQVARACETIAFCIALALITRNLIRG